MLEYEAVLTRKEHLEASNLTYGEIGQILDALVGAIEPVRLAFLWRPTLSDAGDDMVLETAVNGRAEQLVTLNLRHFEGVRRAFGIEVLTPSAVMAARRSSK